MPYVADSSTALWTAVDLVRHFGAIPLDRVVNDPPAGAATVDDVLNMQERYHRLCELFDGTLVEKTMGAFESYVALQLATLLNEFLRGRSLGIALGADGMVRLFPNQVRIPDACFISSERLKLSGFPNDPVPAVVPDLAAEVISPGNTVEEMDRKLREYFTAGVRLVWYIYPTTKSVHVYTDAASKAELTEGELLSGGDVLPGFSVAIEALFALPKGLEA